MAAFVLAAYMDGVPMIYNGQEVGTPYRLVFPFTTKRIDWTLNPQLTAEYKKLLAIRNGSNALRSNEVESYETDDVCAFLKKDGSEQVFVLSNLRNKQISFEVPQKLSHTKWTNAMTSQAYQTGKTIVLAPYSYLILKK
jgi:glycosidase